jgi:hypothetical protein
MDENTPEDEIYRFSILLHEIGNALGISHPNIQDK